MSKNLQDSLYKFFVQTHFNAMPDNVMARFQDYIANNDFKGNMKYWPKELMQKVDGKYVPNDIPDFSSLSPDDWEDLYDSIQEPLQQMYLNQQKGAYEHDVVVNGFVTKWFGPGKTFRPTQATPDTEKALDELYTFLNTYKRQFAPYLKGELGKLSINEFLDGLNPANRRYNDDLEFRKTVNNVLVYIQRYGPKKDQLAPSPDNWPVNIGYRATPDPQYSADKVTAVDMGKNLLTPPIPVSYLDPTDSSGSWLTTTPEDQRFGLNPTQKAHLITTFQSESKIFLTTLVKSGLVRKEFLNHLSDDSDIKTQLTKALEFTAYDDDKKDDYVKPKATEERSLYEQFTKWKDDTYDDYFKKFFNPGYGSRMYYSPFAQSIAKALDKVGVKPTDGIKGILDKKTDITDKLNGESALNAQEHFNWFCETMETIKGTTPKAYAGALKNPEQMRTVVSQIIMKAINSGPKDVAKAKTAMEILSVAKYGMLTSKAIEGVNEGLKGVTLFSDKELSWNKNEGIKFVTGALDKTIKAGVKLGTLAGTGIYNALRNRNTKFGKDLTATNKNLANAYQKWKDDDNTRFNDEKGKAQARLTNVLATGLGASGQVIDNTTINTHKSTLAAAGTPLPDALKPLQQDVDEFEHLNKLLSTNDKEAQAEWRKDNSDLYHELIAYWDMLESYTKTHSFKMASMSVQRKAFLKDYGQFKKEDPTHTGSKAEQDAFMWNLKFGNIRTAA